MKSAKITLLTVIALTLTAQTLADVTLPAVIADNMVLQRQAQCSLWGWADPGEKINVKASWQWFFGKSTTADSDGKWKVSIKTPKAGGPHTITIKAANTITLEDILIGEVWICSGQSNMEMGMTMINNAAEEVAQANYPDIRLFDVTHAISAQPRKDVIGNWVQCSPEAAKTHGTWGGFSATAYYFGRKLHKELNIPIGLIATTWGGTPAQSWTSSEMLLTMPDFADQVKGLSSNDAMKNVIQKYEKAMKTIDPGTNEKWFRPQLDDSTWKTIDLPSLFENTEIGNFNGIVWYRKNIDIPDDIAGKDMTISLGPIDDLDVTYFNDTKIGGMNIWNQNRNYKIPGELVRSGTNIIAVRAHDTGGPGGFAGTAPQMYLQAGDKKIPLAGKWRYKVSVNQRNIPQKPVTTPDGVNHKTPTSLYNGMIHPLTPLTIRGAIWYQGESNAIAPKQYQTLFPNMIKSWRNAWNLGDFPFYYVQIAPYNYGKTNSAFLREAQLMTLSTPNVGMAVTMDISNIYDIHPKNKLDVGERLALWALAKDYGQKNLVYSGPVYKSMKIEGDKIRLTFDYTGSGLIAKDGPLSHFTIAGADKKFVPATATIEDDTIVVSSNKVPTPKAVRFAFTNKDEPNMANKEGLPASSFRTDNW